MKKKGFMEIGILLWGLLFVLIIVCAFTFEKYLINLKAESAKDDITLSNLATYKDINRFALGEEPQIFKFENNKTLSNDPSIEDTIAAFNTFKVYLQKNMKLDTNLNGTSKSIAVGQVNIQKYIIYNVINNSVEILTYNNGTNSFNKTVVSDFNSTPVTTPCGTVIKKTSIHTTLEFNIVPLMKGTVGSTRKVTVRADTDITN